MTATICMTPGVEQPLHPLADRGLGQPDRLGDGGVGLPAVLLEQLDDAPWTVVEHDGGRRRSTVRTREVVACGGHSAIVCAWIDGWQVP